MSEPMVYVELPYDEAVGVEILLRLHMGEPHDKRNVYWRAWRAILEAFNAQGDPQADHG